MSNELLLDEELMNAVEEMEGDAIELVEEGITEAIEGVEEPMVYDVEREELDLDDIDDVSGGLNPIQGAAAVAAVVLGTTFASAPTTSFAAQNPAGQAKVATTTHSTSGSQSAINPGNDGGAVAQASKSVSATSHTFTVQATKMTVKAGAAAYLRTKPWVNDGSQIVGSVSAGQKVQITGIVLKGGRVADWYRVSVGGKTLYVSKSYMKPQTISSQQTTPKKTTTTPKKTTTTTPKKTTTTAKKKMTVSGVQNYLGVRTQMTTDWRFEIGQLHNGDVVQVLDTSNPTYYKIYSPSTGVTGYVVARFLK